MNKLLEMYSRKEEYDQLVRDKYNRFPFFMSDADVFKPEVSRHLISKGFKPTYPDGHDFAICLTHDVDVLYPNSLRSFIDMATAKNKYLFINGIKNYRKNKTYSVKEIINLEEAYEVKSSFFYLALDKSDMDYRYNLARQKDDFNYIIDNGFEIGLHGSRETCGSIGRMQDEKDLLQETSEYQVVGYRNHYLMFNIPNTWKLLKASGFRYDTTVGYAGCIGFRNGMCHPYRPYDDHNGKFIDVLEIPLLVMDTSFTDYMKLDMVSSWILTERLINIVKKHSGVLTILWHNTSFHNDMLKFYKKFLRYCTSQNAWLTSCTKLEKWWRRQKYAEKVEKVMMDG